MRSVLGAVLLIALPTVSFAQSITINGSVRTREEVWNWFGADPGGNYAYTGVLSRVSAKQQKKKIGWQLEFEVPALLGLPDDAVLPAPRGQLGLGATYFVSNDSSTEAVGLFLKQAVLRIGAPSDSNGHSIRLGRFEFIDGAESPPLAPVLATLRRERIAHRLIGNFSFSHVQRSVDGAHYVHQSDRLYGTAVAFRPTEGVFSVNGWPELDIGVGYASLVARGDSSAHIDWRVFGLYYRDYRSDPVPLKADNRPLAVRQADRDPISIATLGAHWIGTRKLGGARVDGLAWGVAQAGKWGVQDHRAYAFALEGGVQPEGKNKPWLRVGYNRSSGDPNPGDDVHETFFQVLPTPRIYARFPFYNLMNLQDAFAAVWLKPSTQVSARIEAHRLNLTGRADNWYLGGGAFEPGTFGYTGRPSGGEKSLATLLDASVQVGISKTISANAYAGWAPGGLVVRRIYPSDRLGWLGYVELEWKR